MSSSPRPLPTYQGLNVFSSHAKTSSPFSPATTESARVCNVPTRSNTTRNGIYRLAVSKGAPEELTEAMRSGGISSKCRDVRPWQGAFWGSLHRSERVRLETPADRRRSRRCTCPWFFFLDPPAAPPPLLPLSSPTRNWHDRLLKGGRRRGIVRSGPPLSFLPSLPESRQLSSQTMVGTL